MDTLQQLAQARHALELRDLELAALRRALRCALDAATRSVSAPPALSGYERTTAAVSSRLCTCVLAPDLTRSEREAGVCARCGKELL